jgi:hypothetical protein
VNPEKGERPPLEVATRQRLLKTAKCEDLVRAVVNCKERELAIALELLAVTFRRVK